MAKHILLAALVAAALQASPMREQPMVKDHSFTGSAMRAAARIVYNAHSIDIGKPLIPQFTGVVVPEPNTNFLIGAGLIGVAFLLQKKTNKR